MSKQTLLVYDPVNSPWLPKLRQACAIQGLRLRPVEQADLGITVGNLAAGLRPAQEPEAVEPVPEPMLVICNLDSKQLDRMLQSMRKAGVPVSCLKCILTPDNSGWSFRALYEELIQERTALSSGQKPVEHTP